MDQTLAVQAATTETAAAVETPERKQETLDEVLSRHRKEKSKLRDKETSLKKAAAVASALSSGWDFTCDFEVDYGSDENASVVYKALVVDKELQPDKVRREMTVSGGKLVVHFEAVEARFLRASFSAFVDLMVLVTKLVEEYGVSKDTIPSG